MMVMKMLMMLITLLCLALPCLANTCTTARDPARISVAGGSLTEILYRLGAEKQIVAVDSTSNYPPEASKLPSIGYVRNISAEGILSLYPTLILGEDDIGPPAVLAQVHAMGIDIEILTEEHSAQGIIDKIRCIGSIIGESGKANELIKQFMLPRIDELNILTKKGRLANKKILFILSLQAGSPIVGGTGTSAGGLISMTGSSNAMADVAGWKATSTEAIISAAPDFIVISRRGLNTFGELDEMRLHPALRFTPAAKAGNIVVMDGMQMLGFGPRTLDAAVTLSRRFSSTKP